MSQRRQSETTVTLPRFVVFLPTLLDGLAGSPQADRGLGEHSPAVPNLEAAWRNGYSWG